MIHLFNYGLVQFTLPPHFSHSKMGIRSRFFSSRCHFAVKYTYIIIQIFTVCNTVKLNTVLVVLPYFIFRKKEEAEIKRKIEEEKKRLEEEREKERR